MVNVSALLLLAVIVGAVVWKGGVAWYKALPCLASSSAAPTIEGGLTSVTQMVSAIPL